MTDEIIISDNPEDTTCPAIGYQQLNVCVPVKVTPFAKAGKTVTTCCGSPAVISGRTSCGGTQNGSCSFTISQTLCVAVPVEFGATAAVEETFVDCLGVSSNDICKNCTGDEVIL